MGQVLIRNLDDALIENYRKTAKANKRSLEAELRAALERVQPPSPERREELLRQVRAIRAMTPKGVKQTPSEILVREDRDGYRG